mmetsp:Transcript_37496/g.117202  ORF Transcript_37496/g.117202 Transcript_37496/m.117202 type:complete len:227 (-) Transcript_37496:1032-1712(-)
MLTRRHIHRQVPRHEAEDAHDLAARALRAPARAAPVRAAWHRPRGDPHPARPDAAARLHLRVPRELRRGHPALRPRLPQRRAPAHPHQRGHPHARHQARQVPQARHRPQRQAHGRHDRGPARAHAGQGALRGRRPGHDAHLHGQRQARLGAGPRGRGPPLQHRARRRQSAQALRGRGLYVLRRRQVGGQGQGGASDHERQAQARRSERPQGRPFQQEALQAQALVG